jgi:hypothetical protein
LLKLCRSANRSACPASHSARARAWRRPPARSVVGRSCGAETDRGDNLPLSGLRYPAGLHSFICPEGNSSRADIGHPGRLPFALDRRLGGKSARQQPGARLPAGAHSRSEVRNRRKGGLAPKTEARSADGRLSRTGGRGVAVTLLAGPASPSM